MHKIIKLAIASILALSFTQFANLVTINLYQLEYPDAGNHPNSEFEIKTTEMKSERSSTYVFSVPSRILSGPPSEIAVPKKNPNDFEIDNIPEAIPPTNDSNDKTTDTKLDESNNIPAQSRHIQKGFEPNEESTPEPEPEGVPTALTVGTHENAVRKAPSTAVDMETLAESIKTPADGAVKFFLTACTMVKNEVPYILEWIEFNRLQGVERIIIYDGGSADNVTLLNELYQQEEPSFPLVVLPSVEFIKNDNLQRLNFQHCLDTYGPSTEWMANMDVDEYLHSPAFGTVASMLRNMSAVERERNLSFTAFTSVNLNFGSSGQLRRFENRLTRGPDGRAVHENGCGLQLITDHVLRGPADQVFGEPEATEYKQLTEGLWICKLAGYFPPCRHNPGKTIFRPEAVAEAGIHVPERMRHKGDGLNWKPPLLIGNHYYYRSRDDVELKARQWRGGVGMPDHVRNYNLTDELLWSRTRDGALRRSWGEELARRVRGLTRTAGPCRHGVGRGAT
uniref:Glycosyltransferase family 92 protein n=1 Tax=Cryptomonas curvata TaxID=233186 RepID=A0A7S0LWF2_9CRYP|mmetsp:Transcript_13697/g.29213  ORF Transcript_13697/g.29213 Transcript_13697/m.29213 type:complete len:508 (+) Transcript_13697:26-1549(+)